jgi:enoyl-[acyl-carrier protein] reductase II
MFEGDLEDGELEIGQSSALIDEILTVEQVFQKLLKEFEEADYSKFKKIQKAHQTMSFFAKK